MNDLYNELQHKIRQLDTSVKLLRENGSKYALAEHDYKILVNQRVFEMKDKGIPATLINLTVYGEKDVAKLRLERDIAEIVYNANQESINSLKLQLRLIQSQLDKEWGQAKND